jgi:glycerol-3-phosphate acyltransferase PlsX
MNKGVRIALDAMGGDFGPKIVVPAASTALTRRPDVSYLFYGDEKLIRPLVAADANLQRKSKVIHTDVAVKMTDKPSQALRTGRRSSSMWLALDAVKRGEADVAVSAGNTGALMAMA